MNTTCCICARSFAGASTWPAAAAVLYLFAKARKPIAGFGSSSLINPAVVVQISNHTAGTKVTQT
ncbi:hypothetical protein D3C76_1675070 [compost metagenome]